MLEWLKFKALKTINAGLIVEQQKLSFIADGNKKWYSNFGRQSGSFSQS